MTNHPTTQLSRHAVLVFGGMLLAMLWWAVTDQDRRVEDLRDVAYRQEMRNYVRLLEAHTRSIIRGLDQVVTHLKAEYEDNPSGFDLTEEVEQSPMLNGLSVQAGIIGADGTLLASTSPVVAADGTRINLSDREHFRIHAASDSGKLWVGKPVLGRASGKWSIQLARRLNTPDGSFAGVVVVSLSPDYIADIYQSIDLGPDSAITVVGRDGVVRVRASGNDRTVGQSFAEAPFFEQLWAEPEGFFRGVSPVDSEIRLHAVRRLSDYALVVMVSRPEHTLTALNDHEHALLLGAGWGGSLLIVVGTLLLQRQILRQAATERRLRAREADLSKAHASLQRKSADLEQFTEVLAHHLQEPVRLQYGFAQHLQRLLGTSLPDEARQALEFIAAGALRLRSLLHDVEQYLSLDRLPEGEPRCDIAKVVDEALQSLAGKLAGVTVTVDCPGLPPVALAAKRCAGMLTPVLLNALTYRRPDVPLQLCISGRVESGMVVLMVSDNGLGIAPEYRERVFRVFERLHPKGTFPGTGIGLSLVRKIVETADGAIRLDNGIDGGTSVVLKIPALVDTP